MIEPVVIRARAKINLLLDVLGKRADGYHELRMIMQTLELHDTLTLRPAAPGSISLVCSDKSLPADEANLAYKAAKLLMERYDTGGVSIRLEKRIPVAAGLAGGSADCAAALIGVNQMFGLGLTQSELIKIGAELGADVPFCIVGGICLAEGAGERLTRLPPRPPMPVLLVKPDFPVSTAEVFAAFDAEGHVFSDNSDCAVMRNALESVTEARFPIIKDIKALLLAGGADCAMMTGSGPTVFACFADTRRAEAAAASARREYPSAEIILTATD